MCGIVGIWNTDGFVDERVITEMCRVIAHRGPDDEGHYLQGSFGMGMRRLSIIDLSTGKQPITNEDRSCWIVFNGEIYNYRELREDLLKNGHQFSTRTDTETILHLYEELGSCCVQELIGMFAFAIWDERNQRLFLARDRMGIKPLYYAQQGTTFLFASEIKSILATGFIPKELNLEAIWNYLTFRYVPQPGTIWKNIRKLPPGHTLTLETGRTDPVPDRYWEIPYPEESMPTDEEDDYREFSELFLDAVKRRLIADVPIGILLSGGLDSSTVASAVAEVHNTPLSTFSVALADKHAFNELPYAREIARRYKTDHHEIEITLQDFVDFLPEFAWHTDEPLADPASIPLYFVSKLAAKHVKVVLSGEGADEIFAGYTLDRAAAYWDKIRTLHRLPSLLRDTLPRGLFRLLGNTRAVERIDRLNIPLVQRNAVFRPYITDFFTTQEKSVLWPNAPEYADSREIIAGYYRTVRAKEPLHQVLYAYCQDWLVEDLLMKADKMTMATSIELRVPFLDHRLVAWAAQRPPERKIKRDATGKYITKYLLRRFAHDRLPDSILTRPKKGFPVPLDLWMQDKFGQYVEDALLSKDTFIESLFRKEAIREVIQTARSGGTSTDVQKAWILFVLEIWAKRWL
ncbi:MAG TPA: asparagine synthase (glutamine-hydrolyzing) [bacterium]|nr:asparagine synthase (glutamine-hydrolyzing) [bacterium]HQL61640.1 asparagine synthase (glutamine-hydrolyzing) [bacterium]